MRAFAPLLLVLALPAAAAADAIDPPPACPPGAEGQSSHSGQWCSPAPCASDEACRGGGRCVPWRVCTRTVQRSYGGRRAFLEGQPRTFDTIVVVETCPPEEACTGVEEPPPAGGLAGEPPRCEEARYCVPPSPPPKPASPAPDLSPTAPVEEAEAAPPSGPGAPVPPAGCGCRTAAPRVSPAALTIGLVVAVALGRRRR